MKSNRHSLLSATFLFASSSLPLSFATKLLSLTFFHRAHLSFMSISMETGVLVAFLVWALWHRNDGKCCFSSRCNWLWIKAPHAWDGTFMNVWGGSCTCQDAPGTGTAGSSPPMCRRCRRWAGRSGADTGCSVLGRTRGSRTGRRWGCRSRTPSCGTSPGRPEQRGGRNVSHERD